MADQLAARGCLRRVGEGRDEEPCRVQGLQEVVAGGRQEPGLGEIGLVGLGLGVAQRLVGELELGHRLFERGGALLDRGFEVDRLLEQAEIVALQVHAPLDPADQHLVDPAELAVGREERLRVVEQPVGGHGPWSARDRRRPMATPVKVWFRCIEPDCSP